MVQIQERSYPFVTDCDSCGDIHLVREVEGGGVICSSCDWKQDNPIDWEEIEAHELQIHLAEIQAEEQEEEDRKELDSWMDAKGFLYDTQDKLSGVREDKSMNTILRYGRSGGLLRG